MMQEAEEQDTCRICSAPAEPDQPLFHPCKCSGTIRYIHQDCLTTWLSHSKKKTCDVCKHSYSFTKVYASNMPSRLPIILLLRKFAEQIFFAALFCFRSILVAFIWLAILPMVTVWTWRMYFSVGDALAWWISNRPRPPETVTKTGFLYAVTNGTVDHDHTPIVAKLTNHSIWLAFWSDIFTGQIIASLIVLTFVAVFLLREWISQNAGPGLFDEEDVVEEIPIPIPEPTQPPPAVQPEPQHQPQPPLQATPVHDSNLLPPPVDQQANFNQQQLEAVNALRLLGDRSNSDTLRKGKGKELLSHDTVSTATEEADIRQYRRGSRSTLTPRQRYRPVIPEANNARQSFEYTSKSRRSQSEPRSSSPSPSLSSGSQQLSSSIPTLLPSSSVHESQHIASGGIAIPRRPPLPSITLPSPSLVVGNAASSAPMLPSRRPTPLSSPSLAMYNAPEELKAGPSKLPDYFTSNEKTREEFDKYFAQLEREDDISMIAESLKGESANVVMFDSSDATQSDIWDDDGELQLLSDDEDDEGGFDIFDNNSEDQEDIGGLNELPDTDDEEVPALAGLPDLNPPPLLPLLPEVVPPPAVQEQPAAEPILADLNDDLDGNPDDEMDGILEAIGLRGPIYAIIQNAALVIFILDSVLGLVIWMPFSVGKTTALLMLDPQRLLRIIQLPLHFIRLITDPVVDGTGYIFKIYVLPRLISLTKVMTTVIISSCYSIISKINQSAADTVSNTSESVYSLGLRVGGELMKITQGIFTSPPVNETVISTANITTSALDYLPSAVLSTEPHFAALGKEVRLGYSILHDVWIQLATGHSATDRVFSIMLGYIVAAFALAIYLNLLTLGNMRTTGRAVRKTVRQQLLVVKVAGFILIELVIFPLGCGIVLDLCTIWLFPEANLASRMMYFCQAPLTAIFYHWVAGTMFMYSFAIMLAGCRTVMRPGAMWFIKDPQDTNSHPIRDILERPTLLQLRKICVSGVMYSIVVACVVGSVAGLLLLGSKSIMPFRWKNREPLSSVPIDLLFLNIALPYSMHYFEPKHILKEVVTALWVYLAEELRLTSYFFGTRKREHELERSWTWNPFKPIISNHVKFEGTFRRVPATDNIALGRDLRATAAVKETGEPADDAARELIRIQDAEAVKGKRDPKDDYMVVYIPPMFRWRIIAFIASLWTVGSICLGLIVALPIQFGRAFFDLFLDYEVHDGYSFIIGFYILWACFLVGPAIDRLDKRRQRFDKIYGPRGDLVLLVTKRSLVWLVKISYLILMLGFVVPPLLSIAVELYVIIPFRLLLDPGMTPRIRLLDSWAMGLLYAKIAVQFHWMQPRHPVTPMSEGIRNLLISGWLNPRPMRATKEVIVPLIAGLVGMCFLPAGIFKALQYTISVLREQDNKFIFLYVYPGIFVIVGAAQVFMALSHLSTGWSQAIRDKEFLVEMRLRNHEPEMHGVVRSDNVIQEDEEGQ